MTRYTSPFPGMDPYLERHWRDVHARLIVTCANQIQEQLPEDYRARIEERLVVEQADESVRNIYPDLRVVRYPAPKKVKPHKGGNGSVLVADTPIVMELRNEDMTETFIEICDTATGEKVVTVIEVLSAANKTPHAGQELHRQKQDDLITARVNLVEIDLLRAGTRTFPLVVSRKDLPKALRTPYLVWVCRAGTPMRVEFYPIELRKALPKIAVPLREGVADVTLDLQAALAECYHHGRYDNLNYAIEPEPALEGEDAAWAERLLRKAKRRK